MRKALPVRLVLFVCRPGVGNLIDCVEAVDSDGAHDRFHVVLRVGTGVVGVGRIAAYRVVRHNGPGKAAVIQLAQEGFARFQGQPFHFQNFAVERQAAAAVGYDGRNTVAVGKMLSVALQAPRGDGNEVAPPLKLAQAVGRISRNDAGNAEA